jgi:hypothetical protein
MTDKVYLVVYEDWEEFEIKAIHKTESGAKKTLEYLKNNPIQWEHFDNYNLLEYDLEE